EPLMVQARMAWRPGERCLRAAPRGAGPHEEEVQLTGELSESDDRTVVVDIECADEGPAAIARQERREGDEGSFEHTERALSSRCIDVRPDDIAAGVDPECTARALG